MNPRPFSIARWTGLATLLGAVGCAIACALPPLVVLAGGSLAFPGEWLFFGVPFAGVLAFAGWRHHRSCGRSRLLSLESASRRVACSLGRAGLADRALDIQALVRSSSFIGSELVDGQLVWRFRNSAAAERRVLELARAEHRCCPFFGFDVDRDGEELVLRIAGPPEASALLEALHRGAAGR